MFISCDISGQSPQDTYLAIGSTWIKKQQLPRYEEAVVSFRLKNKLWGEIKWSKITPQKLKEYKEFLTLSIQDFSPEIKLIIRNKKIYPNNHFDNDGEMLSSFSYLLLSRHIERFLQKKPSVLFDILIDEESWMRDQSLNLKGFLEYALRKGGFSKSINYLSQCDSKIFSFSQFCDLIVGAVSAKLNQPNQKISKDKMEIIKHIEKLLKCKLHTPTLPSTTGFNLWQWRPSAVYSKITQTKVAPPF